MKRRRIISAFLCLLGIFVSGRTAHYAFSIANADKTKLLPVSIFSNFRIAVIFVGVLCLIGTSLLLFNLLRLLAFYVSPKNE